ncbi:MAG: ABC transporter substrate-binding protein, partial [Dehalococcoidia bacterium]
WDIPEKDLRANFRGYGADKKKRDEDIAEAKKLLAAAGYANGFQSTLMLGEGPVFDQGGLIASEQLKAIGVNLVPQQEEFTTHLNRTDKGDFDASAYEVGISLDEPDDAFNVQFKTNAPRNYGKFSDADIDRLIDQQTVTLDRAKRKEIVLDIDKRLLDNVAVVFIQWPYQNWSWQSHVKQFSTKSGLYSNYRFINTDSDKK